MTDYVRDGRLAVRFSLSSACFLKLTRAREDLRLPYNGQQSAYLRNEIEVEAKGKVDMRENKGFSLIELLIVVAIILIIAAIAIPNLLRARIAANEASAVSSLRTINTAQVTYTTTYPTIGYASTLAILGPAANGCAAGPASTNACMIDFAMSSAATTAKSGYLFEVLNTAGTPVTTYVTDAGPATWNQTGVRRFCSIEDAVLRFDSANNASGLPALSSAACTALPVMQ